MQSAQLADLLLQSSRIHIALRLRSCPPGNRHGVETCDVDHLTSAAWTRMQTPTPKAPGAPPQRHSPAKSLRAKRKGTSRRFIFTQVAQLRQQPCCACHKTGQSIAKRERTVAVCFRFRQHYTRAHSRPAIAASETHNLEAIRTFSGAT